MNHEESEMRAHEQAMEDTAARYFLDELSEAERDAFEEHYFDCSVCAATVRVGAMLAGAAVLPEPLPAPIPFPVKKRALAHWFFHAAAAMVVVVLGGKMYVDNQPHAELIRQESISTAPRGPNDVYKLAEDEALALSFDVPPGSDYQTYEIGVRTAAGKTIDTKTISAETAKKNQSLLLRKLPAGSYELVIEGVREDGNRAPVARRGFTVQR
jgi:hypothetical protein